jgi:hypothetical protein
MHTPSAETQRVPRASFQVLGDCAHKKDPRARGAKRPKRDFHHYQGLKTAAAALLITSFQHKTKIEAYKLHTR